jgi:hypothetical protein
MGAGLTGLDEHLDALSKVAAVLNGYPADCR